MQFYELIILAVGVSMDAFAVALCLGLNAKATAKQMITVGLYFGIFQALMPAIGFFAATLFSEYIIAYDHFIVFALLAFLGIKMIVSSGRKEKCPDRECPADRCTDRECPAAAEASFAPSKMLPLALATSIDALAVGISLAFIGVKIVPAISFIGVTTLLISAVGLKIGSSFGSKIKSRAEILGGVILVLLGLKILLEHLHIINF